MRALRATLWEQTGALFKGTIRVNARRRHQAYVSLEGLPCDVLFDGLSQQNRAVRARR